MPARVLRLAALFWLILTVASPQPTLAQLSDDFTSDGTLNTALWTTSSGLLSALAKQYNSKLIIPTLSFDETGMTFSGVTGQNQLAGIQSLVPFQPPFTMTTTVTASEAHGNAYELFLVSSDLSQWINVPGNLNPGNGSYFGVWVNYNNSGLPLLSLGNKLYLDPSVDFQYTIQLFMENTGVATVSLFDSNGDTLGIQTNLYVGAGPFYLVLGQREGGPNVLGPNIATWKNVSLIPSTPAPVLAPPVWNNGAVTLTWSAVAGATYQVQFTTNLSPPAQWNNVGTPITATTPQATLTDYPSPDPQRFYRVVVLP